MKPQTARALALPVAGLYFLLIAIGFLFQFLNQRSFQEAGYPSAIGLSVAIGIAAVISTTIVRRLPHNRIGWLTLLISLGWGAEMLTDGYAYYGLVTNPGSLVGADIVLMWQAADFSRFILVAITLLILWFPTGRPHHPRLVLISWATAGAAIAHATIAALRPGPLPRYPSLVRETGIDSGTWPTLSQALSATELILGLCLLGAAGTLILRLRRARGDERQQIKWFLYAALFFPLSFLTLELGGPELLPVGLLLNFLAITGFVAAVAIAIFKYRLYDIDVIINRTLVYGALTGALAVTYMLSVLAFQYLIVSLTGQRSSLAIVASTLLVVVAFQPLRRRIQRFIDRRFYRRKYRAAQLLAQFGSALQDEVESDEVVGNLLEVVDQSVQPEHLSLWLRARQPHAR